MRTDSFQTLSGLGNIKRNGLGILTMYFKFSLMQIK